MKTVAILAFDDLKPFSLIAVHEAFSRAHLPGVGRLYDVALYGNAPRHRVGMFELPTQHDLDEIGHPDLMVVPAPVVPPVARNEETLACLRAAHAGSSRILAMCTGVFTLAQTGLLDGRRATTSCEVGVEFGKRFPAVDLQVNMLFVDDGPFVTSGGGTSVIDACLHVIRQDHGAAAAALTAREASIGRERDGSEVQRIAFMAARTGDRLHQLLRSLLANLRAEITVDSMARQGGMSVRTLNRRFHDQLRVSPMQWLLRSRVLRARELLESGDMSIDQVAEEVGFRSAAVLRERFSDLVGMSPRAYRQMFRPVGGQSALLNDADQLNGFNVSPRIPE